VTTNKGEINQFSSLYFPSPLKNRAIPFSQEPTSALIEDVGRPDSSYFDRGLLLHLKPPCRYNNHLLHIFTANHRPTHAQTGPFRRLAGTTSDFLPARLCQHAADIHHFSRPDGPNSSTLLKPPSRRLSTTCPTKGTTQYILKAARSCRRHTWS
jgi:hypothetical protein